MWFELHPGQHDVEQFGEELFIRSGHVGWGERKKSLPYVGLWIVGENSVFASEWRYVF